jgi:Ser/Thr protein kinase RdoA (MazF antagonist)
MARPLSDNPNDVQALCERLALGRPARMPCRVHGGLQHHMWRLDTDKGSYAIKQLSARVDLRQAGVRRHYNATEALAEGFAACGVPAVVALKANGDYLQIIDDVGYLVHLWCNASALGPEQLSSRHVVKVARILARMHDLNLEFPGLERHSFDRQTGENILLLVELAKNSDLPSADTLSRALPGFLEIVDAQGSATEQLSSHLVASHGDLDPKNVLWNARGQPAIIDWESARHLNPTYEMLLQALNWSGIWSRFEPASFRQFLAGYREAGGLVEEAVVVPSYYCVLGDWVYWLMHNVGRYLEEGNTARRSSLAGPVELALAVLQRIMDHVPGLLPPRYAGELAGGLATDV